MRNFDIITAQSRASIEKEDLKVLLPLISAIKPEKIIEIGMHQGYSMEIWRKEFNPKLLLGIEINSPTPSSYINEEFMFWDINSHTFANEITGKNLYDFLFIDGDHSYAGVKDDFEKYSHFVRTGGIIALHDVCYHAEKTEEVDILWQEIKKLYPYIEIKVGKNSTGIGVI